MAIWSPSSGGTEFGTGGSAGPVLSPPATITNTAPAAVPLTITGASGQTADLLDIGAFGGGTVLRMQANGNLTITGNVTLPNGGGLTTSLTGNPVLKITDVASAVNNVNIVSSANGIAPIIAAVGADAAVGLTIQTRNASAPVNALTLAAAGDATFSGVVTSIGLRLSGGAVLSTNQINDSTNSLGAIKISATGIAFNNNAPVAKAAAIASPTSDAVGAKAAIDAIRVALTNIGITL